MFTVVLVTSLVSLFSFRPFPEDDIFPLLILPSSLPVSTPSPSSLFSFLSIPLPFVFLGCGPIWNYFSQFAARREEQSLRFP